MASQPVVGCNADAAALKEAGNVAFSSGKHLQAYELFSEAILKDPSSALLRSNRAGALASLGRHEEAFADAELCVKLQPDWWKGYTRRGHALYHLKRYPESEQSFIEALRLNPGEKSVLEGLQKARVSLGTSAGAQAFPSGPRTAATSSTAPPPQPAFVPAYGGGGGVPGMAPPPATSTGPVDFQRLSAEELRARLEQGAAKLSDEALDNELRLAGINVPAGATRADKVKLYTQTPEVPGADKKKKPSFLRCPKCCRCKAGKTEGEKLLEVRKKWHEEWKTWDDARLVKRLAKLGIDGDGLARDQLLDELLQVETERYSNRCHPDRVQQYALGVVGALVVLTFGCVVIGVFVGG